MKCIYRLQRIPSVVCVLDLRLFNMLGSAHVERQIMKVVRHDTKAKMANRVIVIDLLFYHLNGLFKIRMISNT